MASYYRAIPCLAVSALLVMSIGCQIADTSRSETDSSKVLKRNITSEFGGSHIITPCPQEAARNLDHAILIAEGIVGCTPASSTTCSARYIKNAESALQVLKAYRSIIRDPNEIAILPRNLGAEATGGTASHSRSEIKANSRNIAIYLKQCGGL